MSACEKDKKEGLGVFLNHALAQDLIICLAREGAVDRVEEFRGVQMHLLVTPEKLPTRITNPL